MSITFDNANRKTQQVIAHTRKYVIEQTCRKISNLVPNQLENPNSNKGKGRNSLSHDREQLGTMSKQSLAKELARAVTCFRRESAQFRDSGGTSDIFNAATKVKQLVEQILPPHYHEIPDKIWQELMQVVVKALDTHSPSILLHTLHEIMGIVCGRIVTLESREVTQAVKLCLANLVGTLVAHLAKKDSVSKKHVAEVLQTLSATCQTCAKFTLSPEFVFKELELLTKHKSLNVQSLLVAVLTNVCSMDAFTRYSKFQQIYLTRTSSKPVLFKGLSIASQWSTVYELLVRMIAGGPKKLKKVFLTALSTKTDQTLLRKIDGLLNPENELKTEAAKENAGAETKASVGGSKFRRRRPLQVNGPLKQSQNKNRVSMRRVSSTTTGSSAKNRTGKNRGSMRKVSSTGTSAMSTSMGSTQNTLIQQPNRDVETISTYRAASDEEVKARLKETENELQHHADLSFLFLGGEKGGGLDDANKKAMLDAKSDDARLAVRNTVFQNRTGGQVLSICKENQQREKIHEKQVQYLQGQVVHSQQQVEHSQQENFRLRMEIDELRNNQSSSMHSFGGYNGFHGVLTTPAAPAAVRSGPSPRQPLYPWRWSKTAPPRSASAVSRPRCPRARYSNGWAAPPRPSSSDPEPSSRQAGRLVAQRAGASAWRCPTPWSQ